LPRPSSCSGLSGSSISPDAYVKSPGLDRPQRSGNRGHDEQQQGDKEHDLGDANGRQGNAAEAEHRRDQRDDLKCNDQIEHDPVLLGSDIFANRNRGRLKSSKPRTADCLMNVQLTEPELPSKVHKTNRGNWVAKFRNSLDTPSEDCRMRATNLAEEI